MALQIRSIATYVLAVHVIRVPIIAGLMEMGAGGEREIRIGRLENWRMDRQLEKRRTVVVQITLPF